MFRYYRGWILPGGQILGVQENHMDGLSKWLEGHQQSAFYQELLLRVEARAPGLPKWRFYDYLLYPDIFALGGVRWFIQREGDEWVLTVDGEEKFFLEGSVERAIQQVGDGQIARVVYSVWRNGQFATMKEGAGGYAKARRVLSRFLVRVARLLVAEMLKGWLLPDGSILRGHEHLALARHWLEKRGGEAWQRFQKNLDDLELVAIYQELFIQKWVRWEVDPYTNLFSIEGDEGELNQSRVKEELIKIQQQLVPGAMVLMAEAKHEGEYKYHGEVLIEKYLKYPLREALERSKQEEVEKPAAFYRKQYEGD